MIFGSIPLFILDIWDAREGDEEICAHLFQEEKDSVPDLDLSGYRSVRVWKSNGQLHFAFDTKEGSR